MAYIITGIAKNGKRMKHTEPTSSNAKILAETWIEKGAKSVKITYKEEAHWWDKRPSNAPKASQEFLDLVATATPPKPPAGSGLQMQSSFGGGGGQAYFTGASPKKKGKTAAKKTAKKKAKKGSGSLAPFGVMPQGQKTLEEMAEAMLG